MYIPGFIKNTNKLENGKLFRDPSYSWGSWDRSYVNSLIKLGYLERVESDVLLKLKDIPKNIDHHKAKELSKGLKLPKRQNFSTWGILVNYINSCSKDDILITSKNTKTRFTWTIESVRSYIGYLERLELLEFIERGHDKVNGVWFKIKRLKQIPDKLTVTLAQKMLYDNMYKRNAKIDKIKKQMNNI